MRSVQPRLALVATLFLGTIATPSRAQGTAGDSGGRQLAELPLKPTRPLRFTTDEGTWMSLDVSPSGRTIVFDLLGDLYTLPIEGGKATRITSGQAFDGQPHWSPDGRSIVFTSDRTGAENLWLVAPDGSHLRALTREQGRAFISPTFTPDGRYVVASRNGTTPGYNLYLYHRGGTGPQLGTRAPSGCARPCAIVATNTRASARS